MTTNLSKDGCFGLRRFDALPAVPARLFLSLAIAAVFTSVAATDAGAFQGKKGGRDDLWPTRTARPSKYKTDGLQVVGPRKTPKKNDPNAVSGPQPIIKAEEVTHDFGTVWTGPVLVHSFTILNDGEAPLEITRVKPSCGCTIAGTYPRTIQPGESGRFPFSINTRKLRNRFRKSITISSNDPVTPQLRLTLAGECKQYVDLSPPSAHFSRIIDSKPRERVIRITNNTETPLELTLNPPGADSKFTYELKEEEPGQKYSLYVRTGPPYEPGTWRETITLSTNIEKQKSVQVRVTAMVPERLEVQPSQLVIALRPGLDKHPVTRRQLRFQNYGDTPVKLLEATSDDDKLELTIRQQSEGKSYTISVKWPDDYEPPASGATITLKTDDPKKPTITVPVTGRRSRVVRRDAPKPPRGAETLVGQPAPGFSLTTTEGKIISNAEIAGNITVLDFFAVNCPFCKKQMPRVESVRKQYESKGVRFVNVSQTMRGKKYTEEKVKSILRDLKVEGELAIDDDNEVGPLFRAMSYPTLVVLGKTGKIEAATLGNIPDLETRLKKQLDALLAGKPIPSQIRMASRTPPPKPKPPRRRPAEEMVGKPAPSFTLKTTEGKTVSNADMAGKITVLDFFAPNCGFCKKQMPRVDAIRKQYESKGVRFVNVSQTMRGKKYSDDQIKKILSDLNIEGELAIDSANKVGPLFKATSFPTMVIVGKTGKVEAVNIGNIGDLEKKLRGQLDALVAGRPVPKFAAAAKKPPTPRRRPAEEMVGKPAPSFTLKTTEGKTVSNADMAGKITVLDFFAPNCGFCKKQMPRVDAIRKQYESKGVRFVNVSQTMRGKKYSDDQIKKILSDLNIEGELAIDSANKVGPLFKATSFPTMVIVGKTGKVEAVNIGNIGDLEKKLRGQLDALVAGRPVPKFASAKPKPRPRPATQLVGKPAPKFSLKTLDGKSLSNDDFANHAATVLNFVAPNCGFCKRQIPQIEKVRKEYEAKGVRFVNVTQTMRKEYTNDQVVDVMKKVGSNLELAPDKGNVVGKMFRATGYPTMVVVGKDGKIAHVHIGAARDIDTKLKTQLDALIKGKPTTAAPAKRDGRTAVALPVPAGG